MTDIFLQPELIEEVEQFAAEQAVDPRTFIETAVRSYMRQVEREKIKAEAESFRKIHSTLIKQYLGMYVALHNGEVVDIDKNFETLHHRIRQKFGRYPVLLRHVDKESDRGWVFRSPHFEKGA